MSCHKRVRALFLIPAVVLLLAGGCRQTPEAQESPQVPVVVLEGEPRMTASVKKWLEQNPQAVKPLLGPNYSIKVIPPQEAVEYKMNLIQPDPSIDFKIVVIDPSGPAYQPARDLARLLQKEIPQLSPSPQTPQEE
jgi:hypothetical protein